MERTTHVLLFGRPGSGKTYALAALGEQLASKRLQAFEALIIDELGYVQQSREEMEARFTLLAERYEHRSVLLSNNLPLSQWEQIYRDPMTTAAAIDRLVHHSVIVELNILSYR